MLSVLTRAVRIFFQNLGLISTVVLPVSLSGFVVALSLWGEDWTEVANLRVQSSMALLAQALIDAAVLVALDRRRQGIPVNPLSAIGGGLRKWFSLCMSRAVASLFVGVGLLALVVPGVLLALRFSLLTPVVVLEGVSGRSALSRSSALTKGHRWKTLALGTLLFSIEAAAWYFVSRVDGDWPWGVLLLEHVAGGLLFALDAVVWMTLYQDVKEPPAAP